MGTLAETAETIETRADVIDAAVEASVGTNQSRDSKAAQVREAAMAARKEAERVKEKAGVGRDDSEANKERLLKQMETKAQNAEARGDTAKAAEIRGRMKQLKDM